MPRDRPPDVHTRNPEAPAFLHRARHADRLRWPTSPDERREAAVCEVVFRAQLQQPLVDAPPPLRYYLAQQGRDPDDALLHRLSAVVSEVHPLSHCRVSAREGVVDRATGVRGVILQVTRLAWLHAAAVDVVGGYYLTHRQAAGLRYHVEHDGRHWVVTAVHLLWRA
jgi:hypothetical protein